MVYAAQNSTGVKNLSDSQASAQAIEGYDIIGDIHGCASALKTLLATLGYKASSHTYLYPGHRRRLIFLGDFIDRGAEISETLDIVHNAVKYADAIAIAGNHELSALLYFLNPKTLPKPFMHKSIQKQVKLTAEALAHSTKRQQAIIDWFQQLPLFVDLGEFRIVHALWDPQLIDWFATKYQTNKLNPAFIRDWLSGDTTASTVINRLTRGLNLPCPEGISIQGVDGVIRNSFRVKFWSETQPKTYQDIAFQPTPLPAELAKMPISASDSTKLIYYSSKEKPLFVGHYWLQGDLALVSKNIACLDYSAVTGGKLVAYRYHLGDQGLDANRLVATELPSL